ncbi:basic amino acid ABC transporter substrate-binding protein [Paenisporosarcina sp.]|uniref:basic amino acid ABC transporter substrate-binding protein n=1 Tax=Paenisporosarcina sp. TaxID=1932001 RepID=UPI003C781181
MKRIKRLFSLGIIASSVSLALVGCGTDSTTGTGDTGGDKKYIVATDATYAPMEYMDDKGNIVGTDIDILNAIAEELDIELEFKNYGWEPLFTAVSSEEVDFAVSSITITDERKETYDFSDPYYVANQLILVPEDSSVTKFEDLKDKRVSVQINTTGHGVVKELLGNTSSKIVATESMPLAISEMLNGNADAAIGDNAVINEYKKNNPKVALKTVEDEAFEKEYYGIMVKKGNKEILDLLNEGIAKLKENGKLKEITGFDVE